MFRKPKQKEANPDEEAKAEEIKAQKIKLAQPIYIIRPSGPRLMHKKTTSVTELIDHTKLVHDALGIDAAFLEGSTKEQVQDHAPKTHANEAHSKTFIEGSEVPYYETDPNVDASLKGITKAEVQDHTPKAHTLASHSTKAHTELTNVSPDQHGDTKLRSKEVDETNIGDGKVPVYRSASGKLEYETPTAVAVIKGCKAYRNGSQSIPTGSYTQVQLNAEVFDDNNEFDPANYTYTCAATGRYLVIAEVTMQNVGDTGFGITQVRKNSTEILYCRDYLRAAGLQPLFVFGCTVVLLNVGDVLTLWTYCSVGTSAYVVGYEAYTFMSVLRIA